MALNKSDLASAIINALDSEVQRCTNDVIFNPDGYDPYVYLDAIYNYVKENTEVEGTYVGTIPTPPGPDPSNGNYKFKINIIGTTKPAVISAQKNSPYPPDNWWNALVSSCQFTIENKDTTSKVTIVPAPVVLTPTKDWSPFPKLDDYRSIWEKHSEDLINIIKAGVLAPAQTTSTTSGTGVTTFTKIS